MELYRSEVTNELVFSSRMHYEEEFQAYIHQDDLREYYMDEDELEHGTFYEVDAEDVNIYKEWCEQEGLNASNYSSLRVYTNCLEEFSNEYEYGGQY
jgi:hypothetical protein